MSTTEDVKLPAIEHIKARKDGLDVLADIYRYAELGFDAIEPDDLALFRWYGIYTQRAEASAASGDPGPSEETDGHFMLRIKFPNGIVTADQLRAVGRLSERYGRGMGDITTRQNIQLHWLRIEDMPVVLDELNAVGLSFTQACGDVWRNVVGCPLAGVDGHELIDSRPLIEELERTFVGDRALLEPPAQVQGLGIGLPAPLRAARDQRHRAGRGREGRRASATTSGSAADSARRRAWAGGWTCSPCPRRRPTCAGRSPRSSATRATAPSARARGSSSWSTSGAWSGCAHEVEARLGRVAADVGRPGRSRRPPSRPPRRAPAGAAGRSTTWARPRSGAGSRATR